MAERQDGSEEVKGQGETVVEGDPVVAEVGADGGSWVFPAIIVLLLIGLGYWAVDQARQVKELTGANLVLKTEKAELSGQLSDAEAEVGRMEADTSEKAGLLEQREAEIAGFESKIEEQGKKIDQQAGEIATVKGELEAANERGSDLDAQLVAMGEEMGKVEAGLTEELAGVRGQLAKATESLTALTVARDAAQAAAKVGMETVAALEKELSEVKTSADAAAKEKEGMMAKVMEELAAERAKLVELQAANEQLKMQLAEIEKEREELKKQLEEAQAAESGDAAQAAVEEIEGKVGVAQAGIAEVGRETAEMKEENVKLAEQSSALGVKVEELSGKFAELQGKSAGLLGQVAELRESNEALRNERDGLLQDLAEDKGE